MMVMVPVVVVLVVLVGIVLHPLVGLVVSV